MSKEYVFEFPGTREEFMNVLNQYPNDNGKLYCFDGYIVTLIGDEIRFGVERCGHSGGNWFTPKITDSYRIKRNEVIRAFE